MRAIIGGVLAAFVYFHSPDDKEAPIKGLRGSI